MADETESLRAEVAELRAEVERLRAWQAGHVCAPVASYWPVPDAPSCTCGTSVVCKKHRPSGWQITTVLPWQNVCAGAAPMPSLVLYNNTACQPPTMVMYPAQGCAGGFAGQVYTFPAGA